MNLFLFTIIIFSFYNKDFKKSFFLAFIFGVLNDLIFGNLLGAASLIFLSACFLIYLYKKRFSSSHILFQLSFIVSADWMLCFLNSKDWSLKSALILTFISLIILSLLNRIKGNELEISNF